MMRSTPTCRLALLLVFGSITWGSALAQGRADTVLVAPVQVNEVPSTALGASVKEAIVAALHSQDFQVIAAEPQGLRFLGCDNAQCSTKALRDAGDCIFGIAATLWQHGQGQPPELSLTLIDANFGQVGMAGSIKADVYQSTDRLVQALLLRWRQQGSQAQSSKRALMRPPPKNNRWLLGPVLLGGVGLVLGATGVGMLVARDTCDVARASDDGCLKAKRRFSKGASISVLAVGITAIGVAIPWYILKRRNQNTKHADIDIAITPASFKLSLRKAF